MNHIVPLDVDAIAARAEAAPGGAWEAFTDSLWIPWSADTDEEYEPGDWSESGRWLAVREECWHTGSPDPGPELWEFLATARKDVLALAAEVRRLRAAALPEPVERAPYAAVGAPCGCLWEPGGALISDPCGGHADGRALRTGQVLVCELTLPGLLQSAGAARAWAARALASCPSHGDVVLALSEAVANSALHSRSAYGAGPVRVRLTIADRAWVRCEVRDDGPVPGHGHDRPGPERAAGLDEHGRGIPIVSAITHLAGTDGKGLHWCLLSWLPVRIPEPRREETAVKELV
jgi:anti-sigma regulatory factor (Ser/Thr protein kinase)